MSQTDGHASLDYRPGDQPVPGYTLVRELGRGAMGVVWLAQTDSGFERALKVINLRQRGGKKEYRGLRTIKQRRLSHGNLLPLIDYWLKDATGQIIPDSDDLENTDSFFAPASACPPVPLSLTQTTPQSTSATDTSPRSPTRQPPPPPAPRAATLISRATLAETPPPVDPRGTDSGKSPAPLKDPERRPAQLIVAMELGQKTLDDRQKQCHEDKLVGIPVDELLPYMEHAARGLDYLHREGIVHRDVKPHNIMLVGEVSKVCDYGLVVTTDADLRNTSNAFTPLYASPEAVGEQPLTGRSDQYSLAVTYIELRTGKSPYAAETAASVYAAKETGKYDLSRIRKKRVRSVLRRALARNPNERFATCSEFVRELEAAETSHATAFWMFLSAAALVLIGVGAVIAVPGLPERLVANWRNHGERRSGNAESIDNQEVSNPKVTKEQIEKVQPPVELRDIVAKARSLRLEGKFQEARTELAKSKVALDSKDARHWPFHLELLSTEIGEAMTNPSDAAGQPWGNWQQRAEQLLQAKRETGVDGALLAAMHIFSVTRLDPRAKSSDELASDWSSLMANKNQWKEVLRSDEQQMVETLLGGLRQQLIADRQPLTQTWKAQLPRIWTEQGAAELLIERLRSQIQLQPEKGWQAAKNDLNEVADELALNSPNLQAKLTDVRAELRQYEQRLSLAELQTLWLEDLTNAESRKNLQTRVKSLSEVKDAPLAVLLLMEAELELGGGTKLGDYRSRLRTLVTELDRSGTPENQALATYARYLRARIEIQLNPNRPLEDVKLLLAWPTSPQSDWHTASRTAQVATLLLQAANATLPATREGELELFAVSSDQIAAVKAYLDKVQSLVASSAAWDGLQAIVSAIDAEHTSDVSHWQRVSQLSRSALENWDSVKDASLSSRKTSVAYVAAVSAAKLRDPSAAAANLAALTTFVDLMRRNFQEDTPEGSADKVLFTRVILPALELPIASVDKNVSEQLAAIWLAKARLLERDGSNSLVGDAASGESPDSYARSMRAANKAYEKARELNESLIAAAGFTRTVLKMSREDFSAGHKLYSEILRGIVERYDPAGESDNPSLRLASAWVNWENALEASTRRNQLEYAAKALRHYGAVISITTGRDPYLLRNVAETSASNVHVRAAFWTAVIPRDLIDITDDAALVEKEPLQMTKYDHLRRARDLAETAELDEQRRLPEQALLNRGNALEDLSYYCKFTENYPTAIETFKAASVSTGLRSKVYALLSLGRCQYRWAGDAADGNLTRAGRQSLLREAYSTLRNAVNQADAEMSRDRAEANYWLAQVLARAAVEGPGGIASGEKTNLEQETLRRLIRIYDRDSTLRTSAASELKLRFAIFDQAWRLAKNAADLASSDAPEDRPTYWLDSIDIGLEFAGYLEASVMDLSGVARGGLLVELRDSSRKIVDAAKQNADHISRGQALRALALLSAVHSQMKSLDGRNPALAILKNAESLFSAEDDRDKLVELLLRESRIGEGEAAIARAERIASEMPAGPARERALGTCLQTRAQMRYTALEDYASQPSTPSGTKAGGQKPEAPKFNLKDIANDYQAAEQHLAKAMGDDIVANLDRVRSQQLSAISTGFDRGFNSNLERHRFREFLEATYVLRHEGALAARQWLEYSKLDSQLKSADKLTPQALPSAKMIHDFLKPSAILRDRLTPNDQALVENLERRIRP